MVTASLRTVTKPRSGSTGGTLADPIVTSKPRVRASRGDPIPDETPLRALGFLSAHNSFQGWFQITACPSMRHLDDCLRASCRALELDVFPDASGSPIVRHAWCFGGLKWDEAMIRIRDLGFATTDLPLLIFVDVRAPGTTMDQAAACAQQVLGDRLFTAPSLSGLTLGDVRSKVVFVAFPSVDNAPLWNAIVTDSMYRSGFWNRRHTDPDIRTTDEAEFLRVYPHNVVRSTNFDPRPWIGKANFVALNWGVRSSRHLDTVRRLFDGSHGILPLATLAERAGDPTL